MYFVAPAAAIAEREAAMLRFEAPVEGIMRKTLQPIGWILSHPT
jgi:hypothetical protein